MYLAIDVGGTKTAIGLFDSLVNPKLIKQDRFINLNDFDNDCGELFNRIDAITKNHKIISIGVGLPAIMDAEKTGVKVSGNLSSWQGKNLKLLLENRFNVPAYLDQDVASTALGEYTYGKHGDKDFIFLIWGTGVGGTKVYKKNSQLVIEPFEAGYQIISKEQDHEYLEFNIGGKAIENKFRKKAEDLTEEEWSLVITDLATGIYNMQLLTGFKTFILGGGVAFKQKNRLLELQLNLKQKLEVLSFEPADILISNMGEDAGLYGSLAIQNR